MTAQHTIDQQAKIRFFSLMTGVSNAIGLNPAGIIADIAILAAREVIEEEGIRATSPVGVAKMAMDLVETANCILESEGGWMTPGLAADYEFLIATLSRMDSWDSVPAPKIN